MNNAKITTNWTTIKNLADSYKLKLHYSENVYAYTVFLINGGVLYEAELVKDTDLVVVQDPTQNNLDLADFVDNYKEFANVADKLQVSSTISGHSLSNTFQVESLIPSQDLIADVYMSVYSYSGKGSLYGLYFETTDATILIRIIVDGAEIVSGIEIQDLPVVGPGNSGNGPELSTGLWRSSNSGVNFKPPMGLGFSESVDIQIMTSNTQKKLVLGFISLTKET